MRPSPSTPTTTTTTFTYSSPPPSPSSSFSPGVGLRNLKSPIPYLFGGLAFTLALIAIALLMLACSYRKQQPSSPANSTGCDEEEGNKLESAKTTSHSEPRILVIMAGQSNPTFLAKPLSSSTAIRETP